MVGLPYDYLANPLGAVRLTFDGALAAAAPDADPVRAFNGKDWGAVDLFNKFLFEDGGLSQVPILDASNLRLIQPNSLVRFKGMVQDMLGNEFYAGAFKDESTWRTNKFTDFPLYPLPPTCETRLWERRLLCCVPTPGQNSWTIESSPSHSNSTPHNGEKRQRDEEGEEPSCNKKQREGEHSCQSSNSPQDPVSQNSTSETRNGVHSPDATSFSCLVKIYDMPESQLKLNDVFEFVGVYNFDPEFVVHKDDSDDFMHDLVEDMLVHLPPSKVPRLHCLICRKLTAQDFVPSPHTFQPLPHMVRGIRESLLCHLTSILGNDGLAAQCLLLHLLARLRARVDVVAVGKLSLNLTSFTRESASIFGNRLAYTIQSLLPFSKSIPLSVEFLNSAKLQPMKNNQTGRLDSGVLQLAQGTHMTIDETHLQSGMLNSNGIENVRLLKHLMDWQKVEYDFEYYKLEMAAEVQLLVLSEGKSNILPADLVLPFRPTSVTTEVNTTAEELQAWRWYLATLRSHPHSTEPQMQQMLQDEMVAAMKEDRSLGCADLNRWLTMAQLVSASYGETSLSLEHWQMVKELERLRKERLS